VFFFFFGYMQVLIARLSLNNSVYEVTLRHEDTCLPPPDKF